MHDAPIEDMHVLPENGLLVTCSTDRTVRVWDYGVGQEVQVWRHPEQFRCLTMRKSHVDGKRATAHRYPEQSWSKEVKAATKLVLLLLGEHLKG